LYNILTEFEVPVKLVRLIKMCLNETLSKVHICKHSSVTFRIQKARGCFNAFAFQFCFRIRHEEGPEKPGVTAYINILVDNINPTRKSM
jgi:hypothetical protein